MIAAGRTGSAPHARMRPFLRQQAWFACLFAALVLACWAALWAWSASPYARYLDHPGWRDAASFAAFCRAIAVPASVHALGWVLMIGAMMLPTSYPLLAMFRRVTGHRSDGAWLAALVAIGFVLAWMVFGVLAYLADGAVRAWAAQSAWFVVHGSLVAAFVLAAAGVFQFSALKYRCLEKCRAPFAFIASRWHGRAPAREALRLGLGHGAYCVGCCAPLMLVMFVVGMGSIGWMLALAALMAIEKNVPAGRHVRTPLGIALIGWATYLVAAS
jgi:predicted metal-binding membrane protein